MSSVRFPAPFSVSVLAVSVSVVATIEFGPDDNATIAEPRLRVVDPVVDTLIVAALTFDPWRFSVPPVCVMLVTPVIVLFPRLSVPPLTVIGPASTSVPPSAVESQLIVPALTEIEPTLSTALDPVCVRLPVPFCVTAPLTVTVPVPRLEAPVEVASCVRLDTFSVPLVCVSTPVPLTVRPCPPRRLPAPTFIVTKLFTVTPDCNVQLFVFVFKSRLVAPVHVKLRVEEVACVTLLFTNSTDPPLLLTCTDGSTCTPGSSVCTPPPLNTIVSIDVAFCIVAPAKLTFTPLTVSVAAPAPAKSTTPPVKFAAAPLTVAPPVPRFTVPVEVTPPLKLIKAVLPLIVPVFVTRPV
jgi:hypothetical protein